MRDDTWLAQLLDETWDRYFPDVPQDNIVRIVFGRKAKTRLGSIKLDARERDVSIITMNGLFRNPAIPRMVVEATLVHELCHYAHGFNSPLEQKQRHPHAGGVMRAEFAARGLEKLYREQRRWLKAEWPAIVAANFGRPKPRRAGRRAASIPVPFWFGR